MFCTFFSTQIHEIPLSVRERKTEIEHVQRAAGRHRWQSTRRSPSRRLQSIRCSNAVTAPDGELDDHIRKPPYNNHSNYFVRSLPFLKYADRPANNAQMSPLSLVSHAAVVAAAAAVPGHNAHMNIGMPGMPPIPAEYNERMMEYLKLIQNTTKEMRTLVFFSLSI